MEDYTAKQAIRSQGLDTEAIAASIYRATVQGISGARQFNGQGYTLSAIATLWNIRGNVNNPKGRTTLTNRYRGKNVSYEDIRNIVFKYPNGFSGATPLFDDLVLSGNTTMSSSTYSSGSSVRSSTRNVVWDDDLDDEYGDDYDYEEDIDDYDSFRDSNTYSTANRNTQKSSYSYQNTKKNSDWITNDHIYDEETNDSYSGNANAENTLGIIGFIIGIIVAKGFFHFGWIASIIIAFIVAGIFASMINNGK